MRFERYPFSDAGRCYWHSDLKNSTYIDVKCVITEMYRNCAPIGDGVVLADIRMVNNRLRMLVCSRGPR